MANRQTSSAHELDNARRGAERLQEHLADLRRLRANPDQDSLREDLQPLSIEPQRQIKILLSWGGPSDGFVLTFDAVGQELLHGHYFHADWFTYHEESLSADEAELVSEQYLQGDAASYFLGA
jgi:hypothetical protein